MADLITRQAAIDVLDRNHILGQGLLNDTLDHIADAIMALPSAQPDSKELSFTQKKLDTISRQAAIDALGGNEPVGDPSKMDDDDVVKMWERIRIINIINKLPSAQPETHEERTETHSCDCIERKAAIAEIARWIGYIDEDMINRIQIGLNRLPSSQPEQTNSWCINSWCIDCKEYDTENKCCPRYNMVIKQTLDDAYRHGETEAEARFHAEIVRCKDCNHWSRESICDGFCSEDCMRHDEDFYCGYAERKTNE